MTMWKSIYSDYRRYRATDEGWFSAIFLGQGFWATFWYRLSRYAYLRVRVPVIRQALNFFFAVVLKFMEIVTGICLPPECDADEGLYIGHYGPILFPRHGKLGKNCNVQLGATMGVSGRGETRGAPVLGDRVHVGPNAVILGRITIGNDAAIGAGAVVTRSVPPRAVVMGNPARVVSYEGSFDFVRYDGMATDPGRLASLAERDAPAAPPSTPVNSNQAPSAAVG